MARREEALVQREFGGLGWFYSTAASKNCIRWAASMGRLSQWRQRPIKSLTANNHERRKSVQSSQMTNGVQGQFE